MVRYKHGCRCAKCRAAKHDYDQAWEAKQKRKRATPLDAEAFLGGRRHPNPTRWRCPECGQMNSRLGTPPVRCGHQPVWLVEP